MAATPTKGAVCEVRAPNSLVCQSNDNHLGILIALGIGLGWLGSRGLEADEHLFFSPLFLLGGVLIGIGVRRLLRPGCRTLVRLNHGGLTDFRLGRDPIRWEWVVGARLWGKGMTVLILDLHEDASRSPWEGETLWFWLLHGPAWLAGGTSVFITCWTLDTSGEILLRAAQNHLASVRGRSGRC
ncbi:MAG: hypothetical protein HQL64_09410 [Magnetococcales bacterium]|nr:hypothetical protein [Magnetococcales bacterium]